MKGSSFERSMLVSVSGVMSCGVEEEEEEEVEEEGVLYAALTPPFDIAFFDISVMPWSAFITSCFRYPSALSFATRKEAPRWMYVEMAVACLWWSSSLQRGSEMRRKGGVRGCSDGGARVE